MEDAKLEIGELLARLDAVAAQMVTKADIAALEVTMLKCYLGTFLALTGIVLVAAKFIK